MNLNQAQPSARPQEISETFEEDQEDEPEYLSEEKLAENVERLKSEIALMNSQIFVTNKEYPSSLKVETFDSDQDRFFIKNLLSPYLSQVYSSLMQVQKKDYLSLDKLKAYLNLPEFIAEQLVKQANTNQDERIDHVEFVGFFLRIFMGSLDQKLAIAFRCFDQDGDGVLEQEEVELVLKNIPYRGDAEIEQLSRFEQSKLREEDNKQVSEFAGVFFTQMKSHLFFDEFVRICKEYTSELFFAIFSCLYTYVPCSKIVFFLRQVFAGQRPPEKRLWIYLAPLVTTKMKSI